LGVALSPCILPEVGKPTFEINDDEIEIGMGIHGEPGIKREKLRPANQLIDDLCKRILDDFKINENDRVSLMINSLGATPLEELYIISKRVHENLSKLKINITKCYVGRYATSMEMAGMSITVLKLDNELKKYLLEPSECPFWTN
jgi:dihydroxyacetone kinase-like protein